MKATDVTVEMGLEAYEKTGLVPKPASVFIGRFFDPELDAIVACGCLLGALALSQGINLDSGAATEDTIKVLFEPDEVEDDEDETSPYDSAWSLAIGFDSGFSIDAVKRDASDMSESEGHCYSVGFDIGHQMKEKLNEGKNLTG